MAKIKGKGTKPEKIMERILRKNKIKFKKYADLPGKPDFILPDSKVVIFCDGKFWHGYRFSKWKNRLSSFWRKKINSNLIRDKRVNIMLRRKGWKVLHFWDFDISDNPGKILLKITRYLK